MWTILWSGLGTFQTSFTPSAQIWGLRPSSPKWSIAAVVRWPAVPSARTVILAVTSTPGSKFASGCPSLPRPLSPVRTPTTRPWSRRSVWPTVSGRIIAPPASACSARKRPSSESETIQLPWFIIVGGGGMRSAAPFVSRYTASPCTGP